MRNAVDVPAYVADFTFAVGDVLLAVEFVFSDPIVPPPTLFQSHLLIQHKLHI